MILRLLASCVLLVCVAACGDKTPSPPVKEKVAARDAQPTVDLRKAALLNVEMGEKYLAQGQIARAKQKFIHALELKPKMSEAHSSLGYFYETVGDTKLAEEHYKLAIKYAEGSSGRYHNNYGTYLCRQKRLKEADAAFNRAIKDKLYVKTSEAYENAGLCALQYDEAKAYEYLQTAVRYDPQRSKASLELARIELARNNLLVAKDYVDRYRNNGEISSRSLWLSIQINNKLGNKNEVASAAIKLKGMFPKSAEYKAYLESISNG